MGFLPCQAPLGVGLPQIANDGLGLHVRGIVGVRQQVTGRPPGVRAGYILNHTTEWGRGAGREKGEE